MASVIGRDLNGLSVLTRGLQAIAAAGLEAIGASQGPRNVDVQFILERDDADARHPRAARGAGPARPPRARRSGLTAPITSWSTDAQGRREHRQL